ncbi:hypothetical protein E4N98_12770 [Treponema denticola]|uniref:Uncharacterized protein n=1 Tax=Treponema denticola (strain ATCC 35405 / DSM 14222 / CIP 103919 / JCM 8153 / KCTC 15104) TaxID=243275 RepID=Q73LP8_TREDE|nr:hypothetical protein [Treponema denticola]AAS12307.1 hypothetical protein TDE_1792 [Treponema denticola ATCC 35405]AAS12329.1 hypothetical protein TDE_1814 [Treponema denticola ATCC 35405]
MNWDNFFFAFSGAAAALIGVTFAFIVSKLLNNISEFDELYNGCQDLLLEFKEQKLNISNIAYDWHDRMILKYEFQIKEKIKNNIFQSFSNEEIVNYIIENVPRVYYPKNCLSYILEEIKKYNDDLETRKIPISPNAFIIQPEILSLPDIPDKDLWKDINEEERNFNKYCQNSYLLIDKFNNYTARMNSKIKDLKIIRNIIAMFIPIIIITVIYPLHFIPIPENEYPQIFFDVSTFLDNLLSLRGFLLFMLFTTISGSLSYFAILCFKYIKKYKEIISFIDNYTDISAYSDLFSK